MRSAVLAFAAERTGRVAASPMSSGPSMVPKEDTAKMHPRRDFSMEELDVGHPTSYPGAGEFG